MLCGGHASTGIVTSISKLNTDEELFVLLDRSRYGAGVTFLIFIAVILVSGCQRPTQLEDIAQFYTAIVQHDNAKVKSYIRTCKDIAKYEYKFEKQGNAAAFAASAGDLTVLKTVVNAGASVNYHDDIGITVLMDGISSQKPQVVEYLIEKGANVDSKDNEGLTVFHFASLASNVEILNALAKKSIMNIDALSIHGESPLMTAMQKMNPDIINFYIEHGASSKKVLEANWDYTCTLIGNKKNEVLRPLVNGLNDILSLKNNRGSSLLFIALKEKNYEIATLLAPHIDNINARNIDGETALLVAAHEGDKKSIEAIVKAGGDKEDKDTKGHTPLAVYRATHSEIDADIVRLLKPGA